MLLMLLNRWLEDTRVAQLMNFVNPGNAGTSFRQIKYLKSGVKLLSCNIFHPLFHTQAAHVKDKGQDVPKQQIRRCSGESAEIRTDHGGQQSQREPAASSSFPQKVESPRVPTAQRGKSHQAPTGDTQTSKFTMTSTNTALLISTKSWSGLGSSIFLLSLVRTSTALPLC